MSEKVTRQELIQQCMNELYEESVEQLKAGAILAFVGVCFAVMLIVVLAIVVAQ